MYIISSYSEGEKGADMMKILLDHPGTDVNQTNDEGTTALMTAARWHSSVYIKILLEAGADPLLTDKEGKTAFDVLQHDFNRYAESTVEKPLCATMLQVGLPACVWRHLSTLKLTTMIHIHMPCTGRDQSDQGG